MKPVAAPVPSSPASLRDSEVLVRPAAWVGLVYVLECLQGIACCLIGISLLFYTVDRLGWTLQHNFMLTCAMSVSYVFGSLMADRVSARIGRRNVVLVSSAGCAAFALGAYAASGSGLLMSASLVAYNVINGWFWPAISSLVSRGTDAHTMSRRIGIFHLTWSGTNMIGVAGSGFVIRAWPAGQFAIPVLAHVAVTLLVLAFGRRLPADSSPRPALVPEPELYRLRRLALWLSRLSLPAALTVATSLWSMMALLPVLRGMETSHKMLTGSIWLTARWIGFLILCFSVWWHVRPRLLLAATAMMCASFAAILIRPSDVFPAANLSPLADLAAMITAQVLLGFSTALIFCASLYFGMVLSDGSTEHSGYHEALVGLGGVMGPGIAVAVQWRFPNSMNAGIASVLAVLTLTLLVCSVATLVLSRRRWARRG